MQLWLKWKCRPCHSNSISRPVRSGLVVDVQTAMAGRILDAEQPAFAVCPSANLLTQATLTILLKTSTVSYSLRDELRVDLNSALLWTQRQTRTAGALAFSEALGQTRPTPARPACVVRPRAASPAPARPAAPVRHCQRAGVTPVSRGVGRAGAKRRADMARPADLPAHPAALACSDAYRCRILSIEKYKAAGRWCPPFLAGGVKVDSKPRRSARRLGPALRRCVGSRRTRPAGPGAERRVSCGRGRMGNRSARPRVGVRECRGSRGEWRRFGVIRHAWRQNEDSRRAGCQASPLPSVARSCQVSLGGQRCGTCPARSVWTQSRPRPTCPRPTRGSWGPTWERGESKHRGRFEETRDWLELAV